MIIMVIIGSVVLNIIQFLVIKSLSTEKTVEKVIKSKPQIVYKDKIVNKVVEKIVYKDKVIYKDKIVEKIVYVDRPVKTIEHSFVEKPEVKVSNQKLELMKEIELLKNKKNRTKKDNENLYTLQMVTKNMK